MDERVLALPNEDTAVLQGTLDRSGDQAMPQQLRASQAFLFLVGVCCSGALSALSAEDPLVRPRSIDTAAGIVTALAFRPDGGELAVGGMGAQLRDRAIVEFWDLSSGEKSSDFSLGPMGGFVTCVAYSRDGKTLAYDDCHRGIGLQDVESGLTKAFLTGHKKGVSSFAFSSTGKYVASASLDGIVGLWDLSELDSLRGAAQENARRRIEPQFMFEGHSDCVTSVAISPDEKYLVSGSLDDTVNVWDLAARKLVRTFVAHADDVLAVAFTPDGGLVATGGLDKTVKLWEPLSGQEQTSFEGGVGWNVYSIAISPDGRLLAAGTNHNNGENVVLWDVKSGRRAGHVGLYNVNVEEVVFSPDGSTLAAAGWTGEIKLWNIKEVLK